MILLIIHLLPWLDDQYFLPKLQYLNIYQAELVRLNFIFFFKSEFALSLLNKPFCQQIKTRRVK